MKWTQNGGGDFEQAPTGTHIARCIKLIDLGTQKGEFQGKATTKRQCIIGWELPTELMSEGDAAGKPFVVSKFYTSSLNEKATLRKDLSNWRGRDFTEQELAGFEARNILGKPCLVSITPNDKGRARVTGVMMLPKNTNVPPQVNPTLYFSLDEFDQKVFDALSDGYKKFICASPEYQAIVSPKPQRDSGVDDMADDLPWVDDPPAF